MLSAFILIVHEQTIAEELKELLQQTTSIKIEIATNEEEAMQCCQLFEPELIIIPPAIEQVEGFKLCEKIRREPFITRPVIVMYSRAELAKSSDSIKAIQSGADDFLHNITDEEELSARIFAHLRRHLEQLSDSTTRLPGPKLINTILKRKINLEQQWALILLSLNNIKFYHDTYGDLAANQLIKAFLAITKANTDKEDFIGHIGNEDFVIITTPIKAEIIAEHICKTFDRIVLRFYAPFEAERGFTIHTDEGRASIKVPLVSISAGIVSNTYRYLDNYKTALSIASNMKELARHQLYSGWLTDRPLLAGDEIYDSRKESSYIVIVESDAALAYLLTTTLEMQGYVADATSNKEDAIKYIQKKKPDLVLIDAAVPGDDGWEVCSYIKQQEELKSVKIIMATVMHDKEKALSVGADLYIPKPYELISLHRWIHRMVTGRMAYD